MTRRGNIEKALTTAGYTSTIADHVISTGLNIKWDNFEILAIERSDLHCKIKDTLLIQNLGPVYKQVVPYC